MELRETLSTGAGTKRPCIWNQSRVSLLMSQIIHLRVPSPWCLWSPALVSGGQREAAGLPGQRAAWQTPAPRHRVPRGCQGNLMLSLSPSILSPVLHSKIPGQTEMPPEVLPQCPLFLPSLPEGTGQRDCFGANAHRHRTLAVWGWCSRRT